MNLKEIKKIKIEEIAKEYSVDFNCIIFERNLKNIVCDNLDSCNVLFALVVGETERNYLDIIIFDGYNKTQIASISIFKELDPNFILITNLLKKFLNNEQKRISDLVE